MAIEDNDSKYKKPYLSDLTFFDVTRVTVQPDPATGALDVTLWGTGRYYVEKVRITLFMEDLKTVPAFEVLPDKVPDEDEQPATPVKVEVPNA